MIGADRLNRIQRRNRRILLAAALITFGSALLIDAAGILAIPTQPEETTE